MANVKNLTVVRVTPMFKDGNVTEPIIGYKHKLQCKETVVENTPFGEVKQERQETYYMVLAQPCEEGFTASLDLDNYVVIEKEFIPSEGENAGKTMLLKNIYIKQ